MANPDEKKQAAKDARAEKLEKARDLVKDWSVGAALEELKERAHPSGDRPAALMAWPGCEPAWPKEPTNRLCLAPGAAKPRTAGSGAPVGGLCRMRLALYVLTGWPF